MEIAKIILYLNIIVWLFPIFRQVTNGYFYYFLILGIADPINILCLEIFNIHPYLLALIFSFLALVSILYYKDKIQPVTIVFMSLFLILIFWGISAITIGIFLFHSFIFYNILDMFVRYLFKTQSVNFYFILLTLYEITVLLKIAIVLINFSSGMYLFYILTAFEILIAFYFIFFDLESSPKINWAIN